jgi:RND family efflux transporter MFP subunit
VPGPISVTVIEVQAAAVPQRVEVTGQIRAVSQATLSSRIRAVVEEVRVREGVSVSKGQILVRLDDRDLKADLARADAEAENARAHLHRMEQLFPEDAVSKQELDNARRAFKVADAIKQAARAQLSYTVIKAPFDGVITEKKVEVGEMAAPGQPLLAMEDPRALRLEATVAEGDLKSVSRSDPMRVIVDALGPSPLQGVVAQVLPSGDPHTHTFVVKIDLPATQGLKTGMFGRMQLERGTRQTLLVPRSSVVERGELTGVFVVGADSVSRLRWIKLGQPVDGRVEVLSGLNAGERVLTDGNKGVDGAIVQPLNALAEKGRDH